MCAGENKLRQRSSGGVNVFLRLALAHTVNLTLRDFFRNRSSVLTNWHDNFSEVFPSVRSVSVEITTSSHSTYQKAFLMNDPLSMPKDNFLRSRLKRFLLRNEWSAGGVIKQIYEHYPAVALQEICVGHVSNQDLAALRNRPKRLAQLLRYLTVSLTNGCVGQFVSVLNTLVLR